MKKLLLAFAMVAIAGNLVAQEAPVVPVVPECCPQVQEEQDVQQDVCVVHKYSEKYQSFMKDLSSDEISAMSNAALGFAMNILPDACVDSVSATILFWLLNTGFIKGRNVALPAYVGGKISANVIKYVLGGCLWAVCGAKAR